MPGAAVHTMAYIPHDKLEAAFERKEYDVLDCCGKFCVCFNAKATLILDPEEVLLERSNICSNMKTRKPYGELSDVTKIESCGCCFAFDGVGDEPIAPGCGCEGAMVSEIVDELNNRMRKRGDTGQIRRAEQQIVMLQDLEMKVNLIIQHLGINPPPTQGQAMAPGYVPVTAN